MNRLGLSRSFVANISGFDRAHLTNVVNGRRRGSIALREHLAAVVELPVADLFDETGVAK